VSNFDLEYQVRAEQYRDAIRAAGQHRLLVEAGLERRAGEQWAHRQATLVRWAREAACRLPIVQSRPYCDVTASS